MKFTKIKKTLCFALAMAMLMAFVPMSAMAADGDAQVLEVTEDAAISYNSADTANVEGATMRMNRNGNNAKWALMQFNLSEIVVPNGKEIDEVTITAYLSSYTVSNKSSIINIYEGKLSCHPAPVEPTYDSTFTWNNYLNAMGVESAKAPTTTMIDEITLFEGCTAENPGTFTAPMKCEFDVTDYVVTNERTGNQSFIFYPTNTNYVDAYFYTSENKETNSAVVPTMTVTFKDAAPSEPADPSAPKTITATADTHIRGGYQDNNYVSADLYCTRVGAASAVNKYCAWPMVQFDLSKIVAPEGYEIDSAKIKLHVKSAAIADAQVECFEAPVEPTDYSTVTWSSYATQLGITGSTMYMSPGSNNMAVIDEIELDGEITDGEAYEFDVTNAVVTNDLTGNQSFIFYTHYDENSKVYFYSMETAEYAPSMTVTYKEITEETINAYDTMWAGQSGTAPTAESDSLSLQNAGSGAHNRLAYVMFNTKELTVPTGKIITGAKLRLYVSANYYYSDYQTERDIRIANIDNDDWYGYSCAWTDAPNTGEIRDGTTTDDVSFSGVGAIGAAGSYYDFDVTEYFTNQYYNNEKFVSFAAHMDVNLTRKDNNRAAAVIHGATAENPPQLVVTYGDAAELEVTGVTFAEGMLGKTVSELGAGYTTGGYTKTYAHVAMQGASSVGKKANLFIAMYNNEGDLVGAKMHTFDIYSANGTATYSFVPHGLPSSVVTKAYVWDSDMSALLTTPAVINTADMTAEETAE